MLDFLNPIKGFGVTFSEMFRKVETVSYPEDKRPTAPRFHGHHQLNRWPDGLEKCIGCELCAWACPADAIYVEGRDNTAGGRFSPGERYGAVYQINYLRCILCGMCIEACPTRALTMTNEYEIADDSRENLIWTKEQLLAPLQAGMEAPPHPMRLGDDEKDYYQLARGPMTMMPDLKPEVKPAAPAAEDARIGLALLQLLAQAADSQPQGHWVHRRVAQLEFLDTRAVHWRMSVDFTVPESAPHADGSQLLVPITRWQKSELVKVDFRDEQGAAIPLMTAEVTSRFMAAALYRWATDILRPVGLPASELGKIFAELTKVVSQVPDPVMRKKPADDKIDALLTRVSNHDPRVSDALLADKEFLSRLFELSENFVVLALVDSPPGTRRIVKLAFESRVTFQQPRGGWRTIRQTMGWRDWRLEVLLGGRGGSGHLEVAAPSGVDISKIVAQPAVTDPDPGAQGHGHAARGSVRFVADGGKPHVGIRIPAGARRYRVTIYLRVSWQGWLASSWLVAVVIVGSMVAGWTKLAVLFPPGAPTEAGTAATLLLALLGVFATYLIRPGEHPLAARLLRAGRGLIILDSGVLLIAVGDLLLHSAKHLPELIWGVLTCISGAVALLLTVSLLLPWPWKKVTPHDAPHRESDVRPSAAGDVAPDPEGVTLQAPDGFSYSDQHYWGGDDQRELVQKLANVRRAAGFLPDRDEL